MNKKQATVTLFMTLNFKATVNERKGNCILVEQHKAIHDECMYANL